jgi:Xaa-Pro aminopeptidase
MSTHLSTLQSALITNNLDAVLISSLPNITYLTGFSGFTPPDRDAFLFITRQKQFVFTHGIYKEVAEKEMKDFTLIGMSRNQPIANQIKKIIQTEKLNKLGFEGFDLTVNEYERLLKEIDTSILQPTNIINQLRIDKSTDEIAAIKQACELGDKAFAYILKQINPDSTEKSLAAEIDFFFRKNGARNSFTTIVACGSNASKPHHVPTDKKVEKDNVILLDFGAKVKNYCSDMTRTIFFGKATTERKKVYETVLTAQKKSIDFLNSQLSILNFIKPSSVDKAARDYIIAQGYPSFPHSLGHGIGLEVHEMPSISPTAQDTIKSGMVFSIEPGIYLPDDTGVRIEDLFAIADDKLVQLTHSPKNIIQV